MSTRFEAVPGILPDGLSLSDLEAVRLILRGGSVVDWHRLNLDSDDEVDRFLTVNGFDPLESEDMERLDYLRECAIGYLRGVFRYCFPPEIAKDASARDLLRIASSESEFQALACVLLKVMHIVNHIESQELHHHLPVSENDLFERAEKAVTRVVRELQDAGAPIVRYEASRKSRNSLITKLLAKKASLASQVFDRVRFRIITRTAADLVPVLSYLKDRILPYNYVIPGESRNEILHAEDFLQTPVILGEEGHRLRFQFEMEDASADRESNLFSSSSFRMINFIVDMPIQVKDVIRNADNPVMKRLGSRIFLLVEFQMFDQATWHENERGDANHEAYKDRQHWAVLRRLMHGGGFGPNFVGKTRF